MKQYAQYSEVLRQLLESPIPEMERSKRVDAALDGEATREARRLLNLEQLRSSGAFFTSSVLRAFAFRSVRSSLNSKSVILDPTCGAGDLLIEATASLPLGSSFSETLQSWTKILRGLDIHEEFAQVARRRLILAAWKRHGYSGRLSTRICDRWFTNIRVGCAAQTTTDYGHATHVLLNPPFVTESANEKQLWGTGNVNSAAGFLETAITESLEGTRIVAILPEVIRCGARYERFRQSIQNSAVLNHLAPFGLFDEQTDVDVFVLDITTKRDSQEEWSWGQPAPALSTVGDHFRVTVGPVVDFRDSHRGQWYPYLTVKSIGPWEEKARISLNRRFSGRVVKAPFVVIRRTSRPGDKFRAVGSIVRGSSLFAVDNHFIVCAPIDQTLRTCRELVAQLKEPGTTGFLDQTICCRHLTVGSVINIPWKHHG